MYSKLGSCEGFAHWTTTHNPPRKKLVGRKHNFSISDLSSYYGEFPEGPPPPPQQKEKPRKTKSENIASGRTGGGGYFFNKTGRDGSAGGSRRVNRLRLLRQRIGRLFRPVEVLRMVTVLFLNVAYNVTMETFSLPRHVLIVAKWIWPNAIYLDDLIGRGSARKDSVEGQEKEQKGQGLVKEGRGLHLKARMKELHLKERMADGLKDVGKCSKKLSGMLTRRMEGMRRGFHHNHESLFEKRYIEYHIKEGHRCNAICDSAGAVDAFRAALAMRPNDPDILVGLSKSLSDRIFEKEIFHNNPLARAICKEAAEFSKKAIDINPNHAEAHVSLGAALGRLSMWSDNREKVELSATIKNECEEAIRLDPENDLAMHVLGRFEHQMALLGRAVRILVRVVYGGALSPGTLQKAEILFRQAITVRPKRLIHHVALAKLLIDSRRKNEALVELELAVGLPREDSNSECERRDAVKLLKKHWGKEVAMPTFEDLPPSSPPKTPRRSLDIVRRSLDGSRNIMQTNTQEAVEQLAEAKALGL